MRLPGLGMYTRLTGRALNGSAWCWILSASLALASGVSTTSPSTPAVRRPALRSVTRRTLSSVFARERSINFCNWRTLCRSPAFDAVKIRCRNRRTSASTRRQSIWRQSKGASSGPFTTPTMAVAASNLSSGSGASVIFLLTGSPDRVSALSRPGTRPGIRPVIRDDHLEEAAIMSRFPVAFRLPAFRFSVIRCPPRSWALLTVGLPDTDGCPDLDGVTAFRTHELRPGWVPSIPRGRRCSSRTEGRAQPAPAALPAASPSTPLQPIPSCGAPLYEASTRVHAIHPSGLPLACSRPDGTGRPWAFPRASHPADQEPTTHAEAGTGHRARTWNYTLNTTSADPPIGSSLISCDLASHRPSRKRLAGVGWCPLGL